MQDKIDKIEKKHNDEQSETRKQIEESIKTANTGLVSRVGKIEQSI